MRQRQPESHANPLDPVALSLAVWLGLMVGALGLQSLATQATLRAANPAAVPLAAQPASPPPLAAWGG